ncbi:MAG: cytochrome o ubiquinol oxidase subunit IV [Candidatus Saccharimonadales bacterium]
MSHKPSSTQRSFVMYSAGFIGSLVLTLTAYYLVTSSTFTGMTVATIIVGLALIQCAVQLVFFLHLGQESRPRWRLITMFAMLAIFIVIIFGSIWVMYDLNGRMMPTEQEMIKYMDKQGGF